LPVRFRILLFGVPRLLADALHNMIEVDTECTVVGKTTCPVEMSALLVAVQPSHLIADFDLPASFNFQLAEQIATAVTRIPIIALTAHTRADLLYQLLSLNFQALLTKEIEGQELIQILKLLKNGGGQKILSPAIVHSLAHSKATAPLTASPLTKREQEVLALVLQGKNNQAIAKTLHLSEQTARNYIHRIYQKFHVSTRTELILLFSRRST
jgi:two-component system response regulator DesR